MAYSADSFSSLEQPTLAKWNKLWANDAAFNDGSGLPSANAARGIAVTNESTTSTSYVKLTTTTDAATVTVGATGKVLVSFGADVALSGGGQALMVFAITGATTLTAANAATAGYNTTSIPNSASFATHDERSILLTGLAAGSTTFSMYYAITSGTGAWRNRIISAVPL